MIAATSARICMSFPLADFADFRFFFSFCLCPVESIFYIDERRSFTGLNSSVFHC